MPLSQQIFLGVILAGFAAFMTALLYGWIVTKGWEQTKPAPGAAGAPVDADDQDQAFAKAA